MNAQVLLEKSNTNHARALHNRAGPPRDRARPLTGFLVVALIAIAGWGLWHWWPLMPLPLTVLLLAMIYGNTLVRRARFARLPVPYELPLAIGLILLGASFSWGTLEMIGWQGPARLFTHWLASAAIFWLLIRWRALPPRRGALIAVALG
ncbi:MAG: hypothetical protein KDB07_09340, partial [Planctomycetes bacterium]|nr:hypothetical protein [Planctomycetota bacterium]